MSTPSPAPAATRRLSASTRLFYGFGSVAFGVKDNGFSFFLAFFYAQVVGVPASAVGLAIMIALVLDAFIDPIIGQLSDNTRSKWGRRHPWMYAAAIPVALSYMLIWHPPTGWPQGAQVVYLIVAAVLIRSFISCYEVPSAALAAELTSEYDERTRLLSYRYLFGWAGGLATYYLATKVFLRPDATHAVGQLNADGYGRYGIVSGLIMLGAILVTAVGTHRQIPYLRSPPQERITIDRLAREMFGTLRNRHFVMILLSAFFLYAGIGLGFAINLYFSTYFWQFSPDQIAAFAFSSLTAAVLAFLLAPRIARRFDKRPVAQVLIPTGILFGVGPIVLRLLGAFPENGSPLLFPIIFVSNIFNTGIGVIANILFSSMIADVVEDAELKTGRRQEGLFFAAIFFANKSVTGLGIFTSGLIISAIGFPPGAKPGSVPPDVIRHLGMVYAPTQLMLYGTAALLLFGYGITRASHAETLRKLAAAADLSQEGEPAGSTSKLS